MTASLEDIYSAAHRALLGTRALSRAGLAEGTNANTFQIAAPNGAGVDFCIDGIVYHKADADNIAFAAASGHTPQVHADGQTRVYLIQINAAGTVTYKQGSSAGECPLPDASNCALGAIKVVSAGAAFTPGSTDLGAGTVTDTYFNFSVMPANRVL